MFYYLNTLTSNSNQELSYKDMIKNVRPFPFVFRAVGIQIEVHLLCPNFISDLLWCVSFRTLWSLSHLKYALHLKKMFNRFFY